MPLQALEFDINLVPEANATAGSGDGVFATAYVTGALAYEEGTWGGVRPVGQGLWLVGRDDVLALEASAVEASAAASGGEEGLKAAGFTSAYASSGSRKRRALLQPPPPNDDDDGHGGGSSQVYDSFCFVKA